MASLTSCGKPSRKERVQNPFLGTTTRARHFGRRRHAVVAGRRPTRDAQRRRLRRGKTCGRAVRSRAWSYWGHGDEWSGLIIVCAAADRRSRRDLTSSHERRLPELRTGASRPSGRRWRSWRRRRGRPTRPRCGRIGNSDPAGSRRLPPQCWPCRASAIAARPPAASTRRLRHRRSGSRRSSPWSEASLAPRRARRP